MNKYIIQSFVLIACAVSSLNAHKDHSKVSDMASRARMKADTMLMSGSNKIMVINKTGEKLDRVTGYFKARGTIHDKRAVRKGHVSIENVDPSKDGMMADNRAVLDPNEAVDKKGAKLVKKFASPSDIKSIDLVALQVGTTTREFANEKKMGNVFVVIPHSGFIHKYEIKSEKEYNADKAKERRHQRAKEVVQESE